MYGVVGEGGRRRTVMQAGIGGRKEEEEKESWYGGGGGGGKGKGIMKMGLCEKNTLGATIDLPLLKPHNEVVQWNH